MLNAASLQAVDQTKFSHNFVKPLYTSYNFANIPATIEALLTGNRPLALPADVFGDLPTRYKKVVLFFIDAFGWRFFERYAEKYRFLQQILQNGVVSKITSQFPSTTAAHTTCIHTGLDVGQSGVYEWQYYEPLVDAIVTPLLFSYAEDGGTRDTLQSSQIPAAAFYPTQTTLHQRLQAQDVTTHVVQSHAFTPSTFSDIVLRGATVHAYQHLRDAFSVLTELLTASNTTPGYYFFYFAGIDTICHHHGPHAQEFDQIVDYYFTLMDQLFYQELYGKVQDTLFIMTADHGQVEVDPQNVYYLNQQAPEFAHYLRTNAKGRPLVPAGSARDLFLYIKDEYLDEAIDDLQKRLVGRAEIYKTQDLLTQGFFGTHDPSPTFLSRLGNLVVLPYAGDSIWWYEEGVYEMRFRGHHGGLTPEEMETPLLVLPF